MYINDHFAILAPPVEVLTLLPPCFQFLCFPQPSRLTSNSFVNSPQGPLLVQTSMFEVVYPFLPRSL